MWYFSAGDRKSKRARKGRAPVKVSALETIHELKLKIVQTLSMHPQNAALHVYRAGTWQLVDDDSATLAGEPVSCQVLYVQEVRCFIYMHAASVEFQSSNFVS